MHEFNEILKLIDSYIGGSDWFVYLLLGVGIFFTFYLGFPQIRYFRYAIRMVRGKMDTEGDEGDASHFQALATALSGTIGTGNIAGVALALYQGGPAALFWMLITAVIGMTTKFVEVTLSLKYREKASDGTMSGGPMYFMKKRLNIKRSSGKVIKTGHVMAVIFALATILSSFGTGNLPQINSIADTINTTFHVPNIITGLVLAILLGVIIIGGIKRIVSITSKLVPTMAIFYFLGAIAVICYNYGNIIPSIEAIFGDIFSTTAALGGFMGATVAFTFNNGVNRGLFSNEAGQGSASIAHSSAKVKNPVSEGMVAMLGPFIDTILICSLTGLTILASGVWTEKFQNDFEQTDMQFVQGVYNDHIEADRQKLSQHITGKETLALFSGVIEVENGVMKGDFSLIHARSLAEDVKVYDGENLYTGEIKVEEGSMVDYGDLILKGKSLIHSAPLTTMAFTKSWFGDFGKYIVSIGLLLFAFSTSISWSYYGSRAVIFLFGVKGIRIYQIVYVVAFFVASFTDTTIIWTLAGITIAFMTIPNLIGITILHKEMRSEVRNFWHVYHDHFPGAKLPAFTKVNKK